MHNPLIYVAKVTEMKEGKDYYGSQEFLSREDCVYGFNDGKFFWRLGSLHHNESHLEQDLGRYPDYFRAHVILSRNNDFRYFGEKATDAYKSDFKEIEDAIHQLGCGHREASFLLRICPLFRESAERTAFREPETPGGPHSASIPSPESVREV